jgi:HEAT repeat protein
VADREIIDEYVDALGGPKWEDAFHRLIEIGHVVLPQLDAGFSFAADAHVRERIVTVAQHLHSDASIPLFRRAIRDASSEVWKAALDGLVNLGSPAAIALLETESTAEPPGRVRESDWRSWLAEALRQARQGRTR